MDSEVGDQAWLIPKEVHRELEAGDDDLAAWCGAVPGLVVEATAAEVAIVAQITAAHPDWVSDGKNQADPWVIAHALVAQLPILTEEGLAPLGTSDRKLKIRNVAQEYGVECRGRLEYQRAMGWSL